MIKIPNGWQEAKIQEIGLVDSGQGAPQGEKWYNGDEVFVKAGDLNFLTDGKYVGDHCRRISKDAIFRYKLKEYPKNSIVFPKSGMSVKTDNIALLKYDSYVVNHLAIIQLNHNDEEMAKYLYYFLRRARISRLSYNPGYPSIRIRDVKNFKVTIPPRPQLKKIVTLLEKAEQLKQWREEADKLTDNYLNSIFLKSFGNPIKNPKGWKIVRLDELCSKDSRITYGIVQPGKEFESGIPIVRSLDLTENFVLLENLKRVDPKIESRYPRSRLKGGELLISVRGTLGPVAIASSELENSNVSRGVAIVNTNPRARVEYLLFLFKTAAFQQRIAAVSRGIALKQLNLNELRRFKIPLPDLFLQEKFAKIVEKVEKLKDHQRKTRKQIDDLYNVLMRRGFEGELNC